MSSREEQAIRSSYWSGVAAYWLKGLAELIFFLPVCLLAFHYASGGAAPWLWLLGLSVLYAISAAISARFSAWRNYVRLLVQLLLAGLYTGAGLPLTTGSSIGMLGAGFAGIISLLIAWRGQAAARVGWTYSFPLNLMLLGCLLYLGFQALIAFQPQQLGAYRQVMIVAGIMSVILMFYLVNGRHIKTELVEHAQTATSRAFIRHNRRLISAIVVVVLMFAFFRSIQQWIEQQAAGLIRGLLSLFGGAETEEPPPAVPKAPPQQMFPEVPEKEPAAWLQVLEQILMYVLQGFLALLALVLLYFAGRKLYQLAKRLINRLMGKTEAADAQDEYEDEVEQLMSVDRLKEQMKRRLKKLLGKQPRQAWSDFATNRARVRYLYHQKLRHDQSKGFELPPHLTPREVLEKRGEGATLLHRRLVESYEQARYGDLEPGDSSTEELRQLWQAEQNQNGEKKK